MTLPLGKTLISPLLKRGDHLCNQICQHKVQNVGYLVKFPLTDTRGPQSWRNSSKTSQKSFKRNVGANLWHLEEVNGLPTLKPLEEVGILVQSKHRCKQLRWQTTLLSIQILIGVP